MPSPENPARRSNALFPEIEPYANGMLAVSGLQPIGATPSGNRRVGLVAGGSFGQVVGAGLIGGAAGYVTGSAVGTR